VVNIGQTLHGHGADWGTSHLWSLSVEEQFYLLWPFLVWLCTPRQLVMICLGCIVLAFASRVAIVIVSRDTWGAYTLMPARLDSLAIGGLIAVQARTVAGSLRVIRLAGPVAFGAGAVLLTHIFLERTLAPGDPFVVTVGLLCTALLSGSVVVFALLHRSGAFGRLLGSAFLRTVGRYSYGAYVLHLPLLHIVFMPWANRLYNSDFARRFGMVLAIGWMLSLICISLGLAALSYHLFESRFLRMKDRFRVAARAA
jgi:peptidoglycan/LPS O-acetylase OafA/YrhL